MIDDAENLASRGAWTTGHSQAPVPQDVQTARVGCSVDGFEATTGSAHYYTSTKNGNTDSRSFESGLG